MIVKKILRIKLSKKNIKLKKKSGKSFLVQQDNYKLSLTLYFFMIGNTNIYFFVLYIT